MNTGNRPIPSLEFPGYGAVVSKEMPARADLPPFVAIPNTPQVARLPGRRVSRRSAPTNTPRAGQPFTVRGDLARPRPDGRGDREAAAPARPTSTPRSAASRSTATWSTASTGSRSGPTTSSARPRSREAFDISQESPAIAKLFDDSPSAQSCLLATRLVESGVRFVTRLDRRLGHPRAELRAAQDQAAARARPRPSRACSTRSTRRACSRRPRSSSPASSAGRRRSIRNAGRDHYPRAMFVLHGRAAA